MASAQYRRRRRCTLAAFTMQLQTSFDFPSVSQYYHANFVKPKVTNVHEKLSRPTHLEDRGLRSEVCM